MRDRDPSSARCSYAEPVRQQDTEESSRPHRPRSWFMNSPVTSWMYTQLIFNGRPRMITMGLLQAQVSLCESDDTVMADGHAGWGLTSGFTTCGSRDIR